MVTVKVERRRCDVENMNEPSVYRCSKRFLLDFIRKRKVERWGLCGSVWQWCLKGKTRKLSLITKHFRPRVSCSESLYDSLMGPRWLIYPILSYPFRYACKAAFESLSWRLLHQENSKLLIFYLICLNPLNLKLSKIREEKRRGLDLFFLLFLNFFLIVLKST